MATAILRASTADNQTTYEVCNEFDPEAKTCGHVEGFEHPVFTFSDKVPAAPMLGKQRTLDQWRKDCAREAILLVEAQSPKAAANIPTLAGFTV